MIYLRLPFAADQLKQIRGLEELSGDSLDRLSYSHSQLFILSDRVSLISSALISFALEAVGQYLRTTVHF